MKTLSVGEILWDVFPEQEFLGGAALNFAVNATRLGDNATLMTAVGNDARGRAALISMQSLGLTTSFVQTTDEIPTGVAHVTTNSHGEPQFEIPRPAAFDCIEVSPEILQKLATLRPDWIYFGTLLQMEPRIEQAIRTIKKSLPNVRCFYDINLRSGQWSLPLVERLSAMASVVKLNEAEARTLHERTATATEDFSLETFCEQWSSRYELESICITLGAAGCCIHQDGRTQIVPGYSISVGDTVGAGDAFSAAFLHGYGRDWPMDKTARFANALGSIVASRPGATPAWTVEECWKLAYLPGV
jgi:fructokinase